MLIFSFPFSLLLCVHSSFKNFAYLGICLMASNRGMFTSTFLKVSKISLSTSSIFLLGMALGGKGRGMEGAAVEVEGVEDTRCGRTNCMRITLSLKCGRVHFLWRCRLGSGNFNVFPRSQCNGTHISRIFHVCDGSLSEF